MIEIRGSLDESKLKEFVKNIKDIKVHRFNNGEIIEVYTDNKYPLIINTEKSSYTRCSKNINSVINKSAVFNNNNTRTLVKLVVNGKLTTFDFARLACIFNHLYENKVYNNLEFYDVNHIDGTGNKDKFGYINERLYNLEICDKSSNAKHIRVIEKLLKLTGKHFAISANDKSIINLVNINNDDTILKMLENNLFDSAVDKFGTIYLGKAAQRLREYQ